METTWPVPVECAASSDASDRTCGRKRGRILQIHPTLRCNLACAHCYSSSKPGGKDGLQAESLKPFLDTARTLGYDVISLSGGEPFLYRELEALVLYAKSLDFQVNVATNGMLLGSDRARRILEHVDAVAVSVDGQPELHDWLRLAPGAFDKMLEGVAVLREQSVRFGFIHCVTPRSWDQLFWLGEFAAAHGAGLLQLHPLEMSGRAAHSLSELQTDQLLLHRAWIIGHLLADKYADSMFVQLDWLHRDALAERPDVVWAYEPGQAPADFSQWLPILNVRETGVVTPVCYGFADQWAVGTIESLPTPAAFEAFRHQRGPALETLFRNTCSEILANESIDLVPWSELIERHSHAPAQRISTIFPKPPLKNPSIAPAANDSKAEPSGFFATTR